jgi:hypothetical protein
MADPSQALGIFLLGASSGALLQHVRVSQQLRALKEQLGFGRHSSGETHVNQTSTDMTHMDLAIAHYEKHPRGVENHENPSGSAEGAALETSF